MEVKEGYKMSEIGLIPDDWSYEPIKDFASITTGGSDTQDKIDDGIYPFYVRSSKVERINKYTFDGEAILTSGDGVGVGKIFHYVNGKFDFHQRVYNIYNYRYNVYGKYLFFQFSTNFYDRVMSMTAKSSVDSVRREMISDMKIPLPPLSEQQAIAEVLTDTDNLIQALEKQIAKKKLIKQGVMQQLLTPKEGWVKKKLGESSNIFRGGSPRPIESYLTTNPDGINWIKIGDVGKFAKFIESTEEKIKPEGISRSRFVNEGDFLLSNSMSFGRPYILKTRGCIHDGWLVIQNYQNHFDKEFLYYVLGSESVMIQYKAMASGSSVLNLNKEIVKNVTIICPKSIQEQSRISTILSDIDIEINTLENKLLKNKLFKQGLMQQLLTGKIRLIES